ncbi:MAG TPA: AIR synthase related protein, partial [Marinilabiliaceae bacterium]|nr:AIR synthase related protein [Marinilabiliaceae bacterium]
MTKKETSLSELGIYGLIEHIYKKFKLKKETTVRGFNDDSAIVHLPNYQLLSSSMMLEGIHFDLIYTPLQHLGFKMVVNAITDVLAMNALPEQVIVNAGLSSKMTLESTDSLVTGMLAACEEYEIDLVSFKPAPSLTGLTLSVSVLGSSPIEEIVLRKGAKPTDLLCVTGDLGGALIGLHLLEREKRVLKEVDTVTPEFGDNEYV